MLFAPVLLLLLPCRLSGLPNHSLPPSPFGIVYDLARPESVVERLSIMRL